MLIGKFNQIGAGREEEKEEKEEILVVRRGDNGRERRMRSRGKGQRLKRKAGRVVASPFTGITPLHGCRRETPSR